jgi:molybdenum cofactor biosynthesis enzyme MoaA
MIARSLARRKYDFANILFSGPCNQRCPYCIGQQLPLTLNRDNLNEFPLRNLSEFAAILRRQDVQRIVLTGANTDPQLYRHERQLIDWLRRRLPKTQLSLHTNGQMALAKMDIFNRYDKATISFPSFDSDTFEKMTGTTRMPDLATIVRVASIPIKVSCVLDQHNIDQIDEFLNRCHEIGIQRLVFRQLYGDTRRWDVPSCLKPTTHYRSNPVYEYRGMEVTYWNFDRTLSTSLNLFADGSISTEYLLAQYHTCR